MAEEYRIDISIGATDNTGPALQSASKRVTAFEKSMQRTEKQLQRMDRTRWELTIHAVDRASSVIMAVNRRALGLTRGAFTVTLRAVDYATRPIRAVGNALTSVLGLVGIAGGTWGGIIQPLKMAGEFQQTEMAFETLLDSAERAQRFMREAYEFARVTPFDTQGVFEASRLLLAFGFQAEQIIPMLTTIGDAASGLGKGAEGVERIVWALGQMRAKGRVQMEELMQLQELGVDVNRYLQEELGLTEKQIGRIGELGLSSTKAIEAILAGMQKQFGGQMERQSESFLGMLNTIKETFNNQILLRWGEGLRLGVEPHLRRLVEWVEANQETVERWGATLQEVGQRAAEWLVQKLQGVYAWLQQVMQSPEWQAAQGPWEHLQVLWDAWWSGGGEQWVHDTGAKIGNALKEGIKTGLGAAWDWFKDIQGTPAGYAVDALLLAEMLPGLSALFTVGGGLARGGRNVWRWLRGIRGGAAAASAARAATSAVGASSAVAAQAATAAQAAATAGRVVEIVGPSGQVLSRVAQEADDVLRAAGAAASTGSRALGSFGRFAGALGKVGRFAGPAAAVLGTGLALLGAAGAENKGQAIGGALGGGLGGWGGAAAGAAIGSAIAPGVGTIIGGIIGGLAGGFGGEWLGGKIGTAVANRNQTAPTTVTATSSTPTVVVQVTANQTYQIRTATSAQDVLRIIRQNQREIADTLADEIAEAVEIVFSNTTRRIARQPAWGVTPM